MTRASALSLAATVLLAAAVLFLRKTDAFLNPQLWAEDAVVFFNDADRLGFAAVAAPNAGYYHTIPRLVAASARALPARFAPAVYNFSALAFALVIVAQLHGLAAQRLPASRVAPLLVGLSPCLLPWSGEVLVNLTNLQWWGGLGLFVALAAPPPQSAARLALRLVWLAPLAGTGPFALLFAPLFLLHAALQRTKFNAAQCAVLLVAALLTARSLHSGPPDVLGSPGDAHRFATLVVAFERIGRELIGIERAHLWFAWTTALAVLAALLTHAARHDAGTRRFLLCALSCAGMIIVSVVLKFATDPGLLDNPDVGDRYFFIPKALAVIGLAAAFPAALTARWSTALWSAFAAATLFAASRDFTSPVWPDYHWRDYADRIDAHQPVSIPVNPDWTYQYRGGDPVPH